MAMTDCPHVLRSIISNSSFISLSLSLLFLSLSLSDIPNEHDIADGLLRILKSVTVADVDASEEYPFPLGSLLGFVPPDIRSLLLPQLGKLPCKKKQAFLVYRTFELCKIWALSQELEATSVSARLNLASFRDFHWRLESLLRSPL